MDAKKTGTLAILGASLIWAFEPIFAKLAYANSDYFQTSDIILNGLAPLGKSLYPIDWPTDSGATGMISFTIVRG